MTQEESNTDQNKIMSSTATVAAAPPSPTTFLSPRITAALDKSLDDIEDFLLDVGDHDEANAAAAA
eukprot:CAMPEP_0183729632 /NCGR_PEP_ID=MMETSP0737-20130205/30796_1 /TAXON_ID=385413 /ORGANISM="Thalassiosira miniscula, Strain CCMP1093" /LENGTH=65 /DNA_ID=CAMNT_0025961869 /DNA_START=100 /DNA_END=294 /DNA_ORIENTATION=+